MTKKNHHFVPKFYLKNFTNNPRRINLYNIQKKLLLSGVGLSDQCYKSRFYGETNELEDLIAEIESIIAPILKQIISSSLLPIKGSLEYDIVLNFVALQLIRTSAAAEKIKFGTEQLMNSIAKEFINKNGFIDESLNVSMDNSIFISLTMFRDIIEGLQDLDMILVLVNNRQSFITSDNPIVKYNKYYEGENQFSHMGIVCTGLQLFVPISPKHAIILYDTRVYKNENKNNSINVFDSDIDYINYLQVINAENNLYFGDHIAKDIERIVNASVKYRIKAPTELREFRQVGNDNASLLNSHEVNYNIHLDLSFLTIRKQMRKISLIDRLHPNFRYRDIPLSRKTFF